MTQQIVQSENLCKHPAFESILRAVAQKIPDFIEDQLGAVKDLLVVTELQTASTEMCMALDSLDNEAANTHWLDFLDKFDLVKTAYHEAAHTVVGYRLRDKLNRKVIGTCIYPQKTTDTLRRGATTFDKAQNPENQTQAQAELAMIFAGYLNEPTIDLSKIEVNGLGGELGGDDENDINKIIRKWFMGTNKTRQRAVKEASREATWSQQQDAISSLARVLLLEPTLELDEQAVQEFLSSRPELNGN